MATNYAKGKPVGNNQIPFYDSPPAVKAIAQYFSENANASSVITLSQNTTAIEIAVLSNTTARGAVMRWVATTDTQASVTSANYDHPVIQYQIRRFVVPIESQNNGEGYGSVMGANRANGLFQRVAYASIGGPASVLMTEYGSSNSY